MKSARQRITLLQKKVMENLPEDQTDLYGFPGISRELIIQSLTESYDLLSALEDYDGQFESVLLDRKIASLFEKARDLLKGKNFDKKLDDFDTFLNTIEKIRYTIKMAYVTLAKDPIRTETEIKKAKDDLIQLTNKLEELRNVEDEIKTIKQESQTLIKDLTVRQTEIQGNQKKADQFVTKIDSEYTRISESVKNIQNWHKEIDSATQTIKTKETAIRKLEKEINDQKLANVENTKDIEAALVKINDINDKNIAQQSEIQKTIEDANRLGMAAAFKKRKDELRLPLLFWTGASLVILTGLVFLSYSLVQDILNNDVQLNQLFIKIPIFASSVWLGWFSARQFGYISRIREDYSYKYAVSMAFEGYKNATREIDPEMLKQLLQLTMLNISKNPIEIYDSRNNHGTPYSEVIDKLITKSPSTTPESPKSDKQK